MENIKIGDIVQLKSGGPQMTVINMQNEGKLAVCLWFSKDNILQPSVEFPIRMLKNIESKHRY